MLLFIKVVEVGFRHKRLHVVVPFYPHSKRRVFITKEGNSRLDRKKDSNVYCYFNTSYTYSKWEDDLQFPVEERKVCKCVECLKKKQTRRMKK